MSSLYAGPLKALKWILGKRAQMIHSQLSDCSLIKSSLRVLRCGLGKRAQMIHFQLSDCSLIKSSLRVTRCGLGKRAQMIHFQLSDCSLIKSSLRVTRCGLGKRAQMIHFQLSDCSLIKSSLRVLRWVVCVWPAMLWAQEESIRSISSADSATSMNLLIEAEKYLHINEYEKAREELQNSLAADPYNSAAYFKSAQLYAIEEKPVEALSEIDEAIVLQPKNMYYYLEGVEIALRKYDLSAAILYYTQLLEHLPEAYVYYEPLADLYVQQGNYSEAQRAYHQLEKKKGYSPIIGLRLQSIYLQQNQFKDAKKEALRLCRNFPDLDTLHINYTQLLAQEKGATVAMDYLRDLLLKEPHRRALQLRLARYYLEATRFKEAYPLLESSFSDLSILLEDKLEAIGLDELHDRLPLIPTDDWEAIYSLCEQLLELYPEAKEMQLKIAALYEELHREKQALRLYRRCLKGGHIRFSLFESLIGLEIREQAYDSAFLHLETAQSYYPRQPLVYLMKGKLYHARQAFAKSQEVFQKGLSFCYDTLLKSNFYVGLGDSYRADNKWELSKKAYESALSLHPQHPEALNSYAYALALRKERLSFAEELSFRLISSSPQVPKYLDTHAWVWYAQRKYKKAQGFLEEALRTETDTASRARILEHYGDTLYQLGKTEAALSRWKEAHQILQQISASSPLLPSKIRDQKLYE